MANIYNIYNSDISDISDILTPQQKHLKPIFDILFDFCTCFRKYGFNRQQRFSFEDTLGQLKGQHPNLWWFLPTNNGLPYVDQTLQPVAIAPHANMGGRLVDVVANTSKVCTSERGIIERSF